MAGAFTLICGADDYLVAREGAARWAELSREVEDEYSREIVDGAAGNVGEVEKAVSAFSASVMTMPMFGGRKCVWLRNVSFLGDNPTSRSEGAKAQVEKLIKVLGAVNPADMGVLVTVSPVDRRRREFKQLQAIGDVVVAGGEGKGDAAQRILDEELAAAGVRIRPDVAYALLDKIHGNSRMAMEEARKLALYVDQKDGEVTMEMVNSLVPPFGEGDFFEAVEAFYSLDIEAALGAIRRHFFAGNDIRPLFTSLQNRARLLLQLRVLLDAGCFRGGVNKASLEAAQGQYGSAFPEEGAKSSSNIFTQNPYYLNRLIDAARALKPKRIIDFQIEFVRAFEQSISRPNEHELVMREAAIRCLGKV
ncbi:MAG: DNA polymerase III subunit delta [Opitutales bacterium]|jgi:DNA polymerase-3 subunit delta